MTESPVTFAVDYAPNAPDRAAIFAGIRQYTQQRALTRWPQARHRGSVTITISDPQDNIVGGCYGDSFLACMYLAILWLRDDYRGRGLGRQLLERIQREAKDMGCTRICLDTFDFQVPQFYEKFGFQEFARLPYFPQGPAKVFFTKEL